ncbi:hypothetical protein PGTUg99_017104 [Puccinia graminis f. sp. tritici]|uniref:Uncharacterized protein n=1 Tax=Puccinia graminis f. sp. tritici TaxID=56615 RepID=A0A5B0SMG3_PUCGR|nr:hypothetical protein PGTUg99_017104 [Puccinia graminis f. sp. tritici]
MEVTTWKFIVAPCHCQVIPTIVGGAQVHRPGRRGNNTVECHSGHYSNKGN